MQFSTESMRQDARWSKLRDIISTLSHLKDGDFALASGESSNFFFDMKPTLLSPEGAALTASLILDYVPLRQVKAVGGLVLGACPIASAVCVKSEGTARPLRAFYIRKEPKGRGTNKLIEGIAPTAGEHVMIVEDVTTSGGSALQAAQALKDTGAEIAGIITVVDRLQGAQATIQAAGYPLFALFTREDFVLESA